MSSQPGASIEASRAVTSASSRSPATTSSISRIERSCPIASGVVDCGKTTVSLSGSTASVAGKHDLLLGELGNLEAELAHASSTLITMRSCAGAASPRPAARP